MNFNYIKFLPTIIFFYIICSTLSNFITENIIDLNLNYPGYESPKKVLYFFILLLVLQILLFKKKFLNILQNFYSFNLLSIIFIILFIIITNQFFISVRFNRSFIFSIILSPFFFYYFPIFYNRILKKNYLIKVKNLFYLILLLVVTFPGFYIPPFYDGIPGWFYRVNTDHENFSYFALRKFDGETILYSNAFFNPGNFPHRAQGYYEMTKKNNELEKLYTYLIRLYCDQWKYTKKGIYETNRFLGKFAFPGHNSYIFLEDYKKFSPEEIESIGQLNIKYEVKTLKIIEKKYEKKLIVNGQCF